MIAVILIMINGGKCENVKIEKTDATMIYFLPVILCKLNE